MSPTGLGNEVVLGYDSRDRERVERALADLTLWPAVEASMTDQQLESRRNDLHVQLARVNDELQRRGRTRTQRQNAERAAWLATEAAKTRPLDCSDEHHPFG